MGEKKISRKEEFDGFSYYQRKNEKKRLTPSKGGAEYRGGGV